MSSRVLKHSIVIDGHKTSLSVEDEFWRALKEIVASRDMTLSELVGTIKADRRFGNLSSAVRLFVLHHYRSRDTERSIRDLNDSHPNSTHLE